MRFRLLSSVLFLFGLACAGVDAPTEPVAAPSAPEPAPEPAAAPALVFDGLYAGEEDDDSRKYFRFYEDGHVSQVGSTGAPDKVANWLGRSHTHSSQGTYEVDGTAITFSTTSEAGTVDFEGTLVDQGLELRWHSHINDAKGEVKAKVVAVTFGAE